MEWQFFFALSYSHIHSAWVCSGLCGATIRVTLLPSLCWALRALVAYTIWEQCEFWFSLMLRCKDSHTSILLFVFCGAVIKWNRGKPLHFKQHCSSSFVTPPLGWTGIRCWLRSGFQNQQKFACWYNGALMAEILKHQSKSVQLMCPHTLGHNTDWPAVFML